MPSRNRIVCFNAVLASVAVAICGIAPVHAQHESQALNQLEYEIRGRLTQVGLPAASPWTLSGVSLPTTEMGAIRTRLDSVDWPAAVRNGVRNAVVRGGNELGAIPDEQIRAAVTAAVIRSINEMAAGENDTQRFQRLIELGVEDAMVEFFNELGRRHSPELATDTPASTNVVHAPLPPDSLARHLPGNHAEFFPVRYRRLERVSGGWFRNANNDWIPLPLRDVVVARHREDQTVCDIWSEGRLIAGRVSYLVQKTIHTK